MRSPLIKSPLREIADMITALGIPAMVDKYPEIQGLIAKVDYGDFRTINNPRLKYEHKPASESLAVGRDLVQVNLRGADVMTLNAAGFKIQKMLNMHRFGRLDLIGTDLFIPSVWEDENLQKRIQICIKLITMAF